MATAKSNGASFDKDEAVNNCAGDNSGVAPIVSEVGTKLENLHLGGNPGCSSAVTHDDDFSLQKGTYRKQLTIKRQLMVNMKYLNDKLQSVKKSELIYVTSIFNKIESLYNEFQVGLNNKLHTRLNWIASVLSFEPCTTWKKAKLKPKLLPRRLLLLKLRQKLVFESHKLDLMLRRSFSLCRKGVLASPVAHVEAEKATTAAMA